jgi:hypothetical protein
VDIAEGEPFDPDDFDLTDRQIDQLRDNKRVMLPDDDDGGGGESRAEQIGEAVQNAISAGATKDELQAMTVKQLTERLGLKVRKGEVLGALDTIAVGPPD